MTSTTGDAWYRRLSVPFWNAGERRPRALLRIVGALVLVVGPATVLSTKLISPLDLPNSITGLLSKVVITATTVVVLLAWARYVDRRPVASYGFHFDRVWWVSLGVGTLVGVSVWGGALATDLIAGWATVAEAPSLRTDGIASAAAFLAFAGQFALTGVWEEIVFRGLVMRNAIEGLDGPWFSRRIAVVGGWILSSVFFGILHYSQAGSALALGFWILAGLVLGLAYLLTDELALPIGLHFATDFAVNNLFGFWSVRDPSHPIPTLVRPAFSGPDYLVGVAGLVNTAWLLVAGLLIIGVAKWQYGSIEPRIGFYGENEGT